MNLKLVPVILVFGVLVSSVRCQFETRYRLPKTTYPIDYKIWLNVSLQSDAFNGEVEIQIAAASVTNQITVRQYDIQFNKIELFEIDGSSETSISITRDFQFVEHTLPLVTAKFLEVGKIYNLKLTYTSKSVDSMRGLFRSYNINPTTGVINTILASNFLPQYASSVFPCYDDPEFKATFTLTVQHAVGLGYKAISNMKIVSTNTDDEFMTTFFAKTPPLAAHSIALSILNYKSKCDNSGLIEFCAYHDDQHTADDVQLILQTSKDVFIELEAYLGVGLTLSKLDIIPVDSSAPIVGNYGLLINRQNVYYYNSESSNMAQKDRIIRHTIRQIVNLYFINDITPEWWDDIWISDGISLLLEHTISNKLYPDLHASNEFFNSLYEYATQRIIYYSSGLLNLPAIESSLGEKYQHRAAAIMYMFKNIVGADLFKAGLKEMLSASSKSYNSKTFFKTFETLGINVDLNTIMNTWIKQDSYPIVNVQRNYDTHAVTLTQNDVLNVYSSLANRINLFWIPVNSIKQHDATSEWTDTNINVWLENTKTQELQFTSETLNSNEWIIFNKELSGFYHINYDETNWNFLAKQLNTDFTVIPWITRTQLVHDSVMFARLNLLNLDVIIKIANYTNTENEFAPLARIIAGFNEVDSIIFGTSVYSNFTKFSLHKIKHLYERVRIVKLNENTDLSATDLKLRKSVIDLACHMGHAQCLLDTNSLLKGLVDETNGIEQLLHSDDGETILYNGMALADSDLLRKIFELRYSFEFENFAKAVGHIQNPDVIDELLTLLITSETKSSIAVNLNANERRVIFENLISSNLAALDKSLTFAIDRANLIKNLWFVGSKYSIPTSFVNEIKTDERLHKFLEIDSIYQGDRSEFVKSKVSLANSKVVEIETTLTELVGSIKDDVKDPGNNDGDRSGSAVSITISTLLLTVMVIAVNIYQ